MPSKRRQWLGPKSKVLLSTTLTFMGLLTLLRTLFFLAFQHTAKETSTADMLYAYFLGAKFDLRLTFILLLPLMLLMMIPRLDPSRRKSAARLWQGVYAITGAAVLLVYFTDFGYFSYLQSRVNATALKFLEDPLISGEMLVQSYPIGWILLSWLLLSFGFYWLVKKVAIYPRTEAHLQPWNRWVLRFGVPAVVIGGLYGKVDYYPLRWSEAFFSNDTFTSALAQNPVHYFFDTFTNRTEDFNKDEVRKYYPEVARYLGVENLDSQNLNFKRRLRLTPLTDKKPNVVIIVMESQAAYKTGILGHPLNPTPHFDSVASTGLLFDQFFVQHEGTARSMFCLLTGIPDLNTHQTSSRNPLIVNQHTVANAFQDYDKYYFIGGSANWGNIRGTYNFNVYDIKIFEEGMYEAPRTDVWGISDLDLFREAHKNLERQQSDTPFLAFIQAAGFHRPYTIPENRGDFELQQLDSDELRRYGFVSNEEYNSLRFADYSLGEFFKLAKTSGYHDNTIFVIIGDHGLPDNNATHVSKGYREHGLTRFHVPLVFYAPWLFKESKVISKVATEPDILPTVAGITGHAFTNTTMGRNLFAEEFDQQRYAFNYVYYRTPLRLHLLDDEFFAVAEPGRMQGLYRYKSDTPEVNVAADYPDKYKEMEKLLMGIFETSRYMLYNNPKLERQPSSVK